MGKRAPELPAYSFVDFEMDDLLEVTDTSEHKSCNTTLKDLSEYVRRIQNGGFRGVASAAGIEYLEDFTWQHAGVWRFDGSCYEINLLNSSGALVEIITYNSLFSLKDNKEVPTRFLQRVTYGPSVYHRWWDGSWGDWIRLSNVNGNIIDSGTMDVVMGAYVTTGHINFTKDVFSGYASDKNKSMPAVTISVGVPDGDKNFVYVANITYVGWDGFDYMISAVNRNVDSYIEATTYTKETKVKNSEDKVVTTTESSSYISNVSGEWKGSNKTIKLHYIASLEIV